MEKPDVNVCEDKVKDGIHIIFNIKMDKSHQCVLRKMIIEGVVLMQKKCDPIYIREYLVVNLKPDARKQIVVGLA